MAVLSSVQDASTARTEMLDSADIVGTSSGDVEAQADLLVGRRKEVEVRTAADVDRFGGIVVQVCGDAIACGVPVATEADSTCGASGSFRRACRDRLTLALGQQTGIAIPCLRPAGGRRTR